MAHPELLLHKAIAAYLSLTLKPDAAIWYHPPNGGARSAREGAKLKAMGTQRGVPDFAFVLPGGRAAFIELKASGGRLSKEQKDFAVRAHDLGAHWACCSSLDEVRAALKEWGVIGTAP